MKPSVVHHAATGIDTYRIGYHPLNRPLWFRLLHHPDRWRRSWQAEWDGCKRAPRAWTQAGAHRKAKRWRSAVRSTDAEGSDG